MNSDLHRPETETRKFNSGDWRHRAICPTSCGPLSDWLPRASRARAHVENHKEELRAQVPEGYFCAWEPFHNRRPWEICYTCAEGRRTGRLTV